MLEACWGRGEAPGLSHRCRYTRQRDRSGEILACSALRFQQLGIHSFSAFGALLTPLLARVV